MNRLNFDIFCLRWNIAYRIITDTELWSCPRAKHSHKSWGKPVSDSGHFMCYTKSDHVWEPCWDCDDFMVDHHNGLEHNRCSRCDIAEDWAK